MLRATVTICRPHSGSPKLVKVRFVSSSIEVTSLSKNFRLYHERNQNLKSSILRGRRSRFEEFWALDEVSFAVENGKTFGVIGSNGSGKSTLLKCIAGILQPDKGSVKVRGRVSALLELGAGFHPELSGRENVFLNGSILGLRRKELERRFDEIVDFAGVGKFIDTPVKNYSSGMFVRLGFSVAVNVDPDVFLVDEVLSVGDVSFQKRSAEKIDEFRRAGKTILFVSHGLGQVVELCDEVLWLEKGSVRALGDAASLVREYSGEGEAEVGGADEGENGSSVGSRWGSGEIQITSVDLFDGDGQSVQHPRTLDPLTVRVNLTAHAPIQDSVLVAKIDQLGGHTVWQSSTRRNGVSIGLIKESASVELKFPALPLLEGTYELSLGITDQTEVQPYDWWERRIRFDMRQYVNSDHGVVHIPTQWTVDGASDIVQMG